MPRRRSARGAPRGEGSGNAAPAERAASVEEARALALRVLAFHARSEAQLRARLARAGHEDCADEVLAWLKRLGYVDDAAYAAGRARAMLGSGRAGPRLAERRLTAAGIPREAARAAIAAALGELGSADAPEAASAGAPAAGGELELCRAAAERKLRGRAPSPASLDPKERARLARHLLGRGFSAAVVSRVVRMELDEEA